MAKPTQPPVAQYNILETFSDNSFDNLKKILLPLIGTPPVIGHDDRIGDLYDLSQELEFNSCLLDNSFDIEELSITSIKVTVGQCIIGGVCIDIKEEKTLYINGTNSYFDWVSPITGTGTVYILIYYDYDYDPGLEDQLAYVGLMKKTDYALLSTEEKKKYCFIGAIKVNASVEIISPLHYTDPDDLSVSRPYPRGWGDGGWIDIPEEFIV